MTDRKTLYQTWATAERYLADTLLKVAVQRYEVERVANLLANSDDLPDEERWALIREIDRACTILYRLVDLADAWRHDVNEAQRNVVEAENGLTHEELVEMADSCGRTWDDISHLPSTEVSDAS